nr:MAG: hypothetical protein [Caudoviricetes sp.]
MYKFAIINYGTVSNIIESNDYETINLLKQYNDTVVMVNNQDVEIGYLWDGSKFYKDPILEGKENKAIDRQMSEMFERKRQMYENLKGKENLTPEETESFNILKLDFE